MWLEILILNLEKGSFDVKRENDTLTKFSWRFLSKFCELKSVKTRRQNFTGGIAKENIRNQILTPQVSLTHLAKKINFKIPIFYSTIASTLTSHLSNFLSQNDCCWYPHSSTPKDTEKVSQTLAKPSPLNEPNFYILTECHLIPQSNVWPFKLAPPLHTYIAKKKFFSCDYLND